MSPDLPLEVRGHNGTVRFDGITVTIARIGFLARASVGKGEKQIPLRAITAVQFKPAGPLMNGFIQFSLGGGNEARSRFGQQTGQAVNDENSVVFTRAQRDAFAGLRDTVQMAMAALASGAGPMPPAPDPVAQLQQLAALHRSGALSDAEYAAAKQSVLGGMG